MKHKIKRVIQKIGIFLVKKLYRASRVKLTNTEVDASILFRKLLIDPNTELLISPLSGKYFLKNDERNLLVVLSCNNVSIINHIFGYDISIPSFLYENLRNIFNEEVECRSQKMEDEYRNNVRHNLQQVIKSLKNEKK